MARTVVIRAASKGLSRDTFWNAHDVLRRVRDAADARGVGRWALLASCLARVATYVPVDTVLPAIVGSYASLNYFVAIAAGSSGGKSAAQSVARELLPIPEVDRLPLSTGQGLVASYVTYVPERRGNKAEGTEPVPAHLERVRTAALFTVDEIGDIEAKVNSGSNNLMPVIRSAWGGEDQGSSTVTKENRLRLSAHTYRMGLIINTQLGAARFLLNDSDVGTPQRFLFVPAVDHSALTEEQIMAMSSAELAPSDEAVRPISLDHRPFVLLDTLDLEAPEWFHTVKVCQDALDEVRRDRLRAQAGRPVKFPPHHLLNRLKTASLLHFLCGGNGDVTDEYWELSGILMEVSEETKAMLIEHAAQAEAEENAKQGERFARVEDAKKATQAEAEDKKLANAQERILEKLKAGPMTYRQIRELFNSSNRKAGMDALTALVEEASICRSDETYLLAR